MACASCGGGRQLTPNKQAVQPQSISQSPNRIVISPQRSGGVKTVMTPNKQTTRTQV